ncbi:MAG TPA: DUF4148 domain-containing protein [Paraburkholderia sp.]|jgi:hypothetical protein|nr:DUF4148 domain-containing protein [Paraburkholderia sp.]
MKLIRYAALATMAGAMLTFGQAAFAQSADPTGAMTPPAASANTGKTRAEVRAELVQAEAQGLLPVGENNYPPTAQQIARNREIYQIRHSDSGTSTAAN